MATPLVVRSPRTQLEITQAQVAGIEHWLAARARWEAADRSHLTREERMDLERERAAMEREHQALVERARLHQLRGGRAVQERPGVRAVLAHRNQWMRDKVAAFLSVAGLTVVGSFDDGADAAGTLVVEQPDLVLLEDRLPTLSGRTVVRRAREFAPDAVVAVQVVDSSGVAGMVDAGAHAVFTRRVPPADLVDGLIPCLTARSGPLVLT